MAEAVVSIALETLRDLLKEEGRFLFGVRGEVEALERQLKEMKCLLKDTDKRQHESEVVHNWMAQIRDLTHRAEDAIETYAVRVSSKRGRRLKQLIRRFSCILNEGVSLHQIGSKISEIKSEIARVAKSMQEYGIKNIIHGESSRAVNINEENQKWLRQTFPFEIDDCFVGKEDDLKRLVSLLVDDDKQHRVISVWGMGGIGKTTIARKVYNHIETKRAFDSFAWVCITQQCHIRSVLEDVLKQLNPRKKDEDDVSNPRKMDEDDVSKLSNTELIQQLCQIQTTNRCMIVLDDLWEIDHWNCLKPAFLVQGLNSKIFLTTRKINVADVGFSVELGLLNADDGWELLKKKAFPCSNIPGSEFEEKLQKIGKELVRKCGYLPLIISLLGGVLSKKNSIEEWDSVNENINKYLYGGEDIEKEKEIQGVLNLSYEDLPYYLKPCFLYMGQFKEDEFISANDLYRLWIAHGMISHENHREDMTLMEIAELYLNELASRCIVQVQDIVSGLKRRSCQLHDVVRELCLSKAKKEDFGIQILNYEGGKFCNLLHESSSGIRTRHLTIHLVREPENYESTITATESTDEDTSRHVRSLRYLNDVKPFSDVPHTIVDFQKFKLLRSLVLVRFSLLGRKFPRGISNLIHLRYLLLQQCRSLALPSSISNLAYLETLDLYASEDIRVPNFLEKMPRLKHLFLPFCQVERKKDYLLRMDGLEELETLNGFDSLQHDLKSLTRMKNLRRFQARVHDHESLLGIINSITPNWKNLRHFTLEVEQGCQFVSVDEGLMNLKKLFTCPKLYNLVIRVRLGNLLEECSTQITVSKLARLCLRECKIEDDPMKILGKLPFLEKLILSVRSFVGEEMTSHVSSFDRLKTLVLIGLKNLREWRVEQGAMPILSKIAIKRCRRLEMVPDGLRFIVTLKTLEIRAMPDLAKRVSSDGGEDFDKVRHVPSILIVN